MTASVLAERQGSVLTLTLNRPDRRNALGPDIVEPLLAAVEGAPSDGVRLIVFRGAGRHFCAGFDLANLENLSDGDLLARLIRIETLLQAVRHAPVVTAAVVHGAAIGAGADLVAACEARLVLKEATFAFPGAGFGIALGTRRLTERVGEGAARDLITSGRRIDAAEALALGLVQRVAGEAELGGVLDPLADRAGRLDPGTQTAIHALSVADGRDRDMAALVASASRPGLKSRVQAYVDSLSRARTAAKREETGR